MKKRIYTARDIRGLKPRRDLGVPGTFPYTRAIRADLYENRFWTMRLFSGFGLPDETNRRFHYLLKQGETGLSVAFDLPTLLGYDSDDPQAEGEVGRCGVAIDSLEDMELLFSKIHLDQVSTSMTINGPAAILYAMYLACAKKKGVPWSKIRGTLQNDCLKEYIAQNTWTFPPVPALRLITDIFAFSARHVPKFNTISISGYHIREAGATAAQELGFTLANGFTYVEAGIRAGLAVDAFAPRLSFFFNSHLNFFEEIAKYRAARKLWAQTMKRRFKAREEQSLKLRFHTQTAGCTLTRQQPYNNIVRTAYQALAAVLGGTQSLHTNSLDETFSLPSDETAKLALRTQQILAHETGVTQVVDPLGGSYYVEALTAGLEHQAREILNEIRREGGVLACIESGWFQREIARSAYAEQMAIERREKIVVGVNAYAEPDEKSALHILEVSPAIEQKQCRRLKGLKKKRSARRVQRALDRLQERAESQQNLMPSLVEAALSNATLGEMTRTLKGVFGEYEPPTVL
ncbi:MAG: methylmalonyl-CoA mutase [Candidatus Omnitrophica bacterium]|nr:methylmalonyl-CoA mutase [Candidatus Omnitrophota bacterium]